MPIELVVPEVGESITEVEIGQWLKNEGDAVSKNDPVVEIETDKVTLELPAPADGTLSKLLKKRGEPARVGDVIGYLDEGPARGTEDSGRKPKVSGIKAQVTPERSAPGGRAPAGDTKAMPPAESAPLGPVVQAAAKARVTETTRPGPVQAGTGSREEQRVPMSPMRRRIAERLVQAQQTAALLTTFSEIDMGAVMDLRARYQDAFFAKYNIKLGFMSFFVKATIDALKLYPQINAEVRGKDILYRNYFDIGIAIGSGKGLVVPVLRNAERMSFAQVERAIADYAEQAKTKRLRIEDLQGGTFTITNGGVFGSLLSTPIINPPQSGVLGMHAIQKRPVVIDDQIVVRPMMYVALSYDHRVVDGREAVTFLVRLKQTIEAPARMLMEV